ncbi:uncharacterized protein ARMOST_11518 [Armillaria ostoyae]|uniref:Uncharacterized protein n=1 Tax=Armillaria ostoyae TaxID=47428 RepID=A0A284RHC7_ARMOS|nr:uncharacterized protein ARMOST_11518 [Armillaria ostoyae]
MSPTKKIASQKCKRATIPTTREASHVDSGDVVASRRSVSPVVEESPAKHVKTTARMSTGGRHPRKELLSPVTIIARSPAVPARRRLHRAISFGDLSGEDIDAVVSAECSHASTPVVASTQSWTNSVEDLVDLEAEESDADHWPCDNNKHIPGKLSLCKGLPMMIHLNSATELSITKGQECTVHSWAEAIGSRGQKILETLFVTMSNPPQDVNVPGLPVNVVPLVRTSQAITCYLVDDSSININRSQVEIIPNFAMTDYCSQGKTRPINPVDLTNCRSHQSYYTALSRSASAAGTVILPDYTDPRLFTFDPKKIQGGCSGHLRQEFRELEMLDHITQLQYEGNIPVTVYGERRYDLIEHFQKVYGAEFVPPRVERTLRWSAVDPFKPIECSMFEWDVNKFEHAPTGIVKDVVNKALQPNESSRASDMVQGKIGCKVAQRNITPMKVPGKRKGRQSDEGANDLTHMKIKESDSLASTDRYRSTISSVDQVPAGCLWASNSCPFDSIMFILANVWDRCPIVYNDVFADINTEWFGTLAEALVARREGRYSLEQRNESECHFGKVVQKGVTSISN